MTLLLHFVVMFCGCGDASFRAETFLRCLQRYNRNSTGTRSAFSVWNVVNRWVETLDVAAVESWHNMVRHHRRTSKKRKENKDLWYNSDALWFRQRKGWTSMCSLPCELVSLSLVVIQKMNNSNSVVDQLDKKKNNYFYECFCGTRITIL